MNSSCQLKVTLNMVNAISTFSPREMCIDLYYYHKYEKGGSKSGKETFAAINYNPSARGDLPCIIDHRPWGGARYALYDLARDTIHRFYLLMISS